jgi:hypothetical protein
MLTAYRELRETKGHRRACEILGRRTGIDAGTINRVIRRAEEDERRFAEREVRELREAA